MILLGEVVACQERLIELLVLLAFGKPIVELCLCRCIEWMQQRLADDVIYPYVYLPFVIFNTITDDKRLQEKKKMIYLSPTFS